MGRANATDAELVAASQRGELAAFGEIVERYQHVVGAASYRGTRDRTLGEDVVQETFVTAWLQLDRLRDVAALREWLCGIARNIARRARLLREREAPTDEIAAIDTATPFDAMSRRETERVVAAALARLPESYRAPLALYYNEQRSVHEVSAALGISVDAVHQRLSRGRQLIADDIACLVERALEDRRRRSIVPFAIAPSHAAFGGWNMLKLGIPAAIAAAIAAAYITEPSRAEPAHVAPAIAPATIAKSPLRPIVTPPPALPAIASDEPTCARAAHHLIEIGLDMAPTPPNPSDLPEIAKLVENECLAGQWSPSFIDCISRAPDVWSTMICRRNTASIDPSPDTDGADISCAAVGRNVARHVETLRALVPAEAHHAIDELHGNLETSCTANDWPEDTRRCYATAASLAGLEACK
jgi:RNA polymerase sigma factor (sigma-70 family)